MDKLIDDWFMNQHYSKEELQQLDDWVEESGNDVVIKFINNKWSGFHVNDINLKIDIAGQETKEDCMNWMKRLGFNPVN